MLATVQINFDHPWSDEEINAAAGDWARNVKPTIPGLLWKIFGKGSGEGKTCGLYLFENIDAAKAYVDSEVVKALYDMPGVTNVEIIILEVMEEASTIAGATLKEAS